MRPRLGQVKSQDVLSSAGSQYPRGASGEGHQARDPGAKLEGWVVAKKVIMTLSSPPPPPYLAHASSSAASSATPSPHTAPPGGGSSVTQTTYSKGLSRHIEAWKSAYCTSRGGVLTLGGSPMDRAPMRCLLRPGELRRHVYSDHKHCISLRAHVLGAPAASISASSSSGSAASASQAEGALRDEELVELDMSFESEALCSEWLNGLGTQMAFVKSLQQDIVDSAARSATAALKIRARELQEQLEAQTKDQSGLGFSPVLFDACGDDFVMIESEDEGDADKGGFQRTQAAPQKSTCTNVNLPPEIVNLARRFRYSALERPISAPLRASSRVELCSSLNSRWRVPVPSLRVLIMAVGTRGDVQPFILLGQKLQRDGHRVRLATHRNFRQLIVAESGLEFYPLGGDPHILSQFMVKTRGFVVPTTTEALSQVPQNVAMVNEIIHSCWGACIYPDPLDASKKPFIADAIISNPVTYGHIHCAEALGVPLHMMFPQPWVPTKAFPHPLACMSYKRGWGTENFLSYQAIDRVMWHTFGPCINNFRVKTLKLRPLRFGDVGYDLINFHKVPFVKMWSRFVAPKPKDWPEHVEVVGSFIAPAEIAKTTHKTAEPAGEQPRSAMEERLDIFLNADSQKPIFVGFGSMMVEDTEALIKTVLEGAARANVRVLVQSGWSRIDDDWFTATAKLVSHEILMAQEASSPKATQEKVCEDLLSLPELEPRPRRSSQVLWSPDKACLIGNYPHDKLFGRVAAVVHHGGAGTTAAGLVAGKPTFICPFFGDQHFWGEMVHKSGLGPAPCPINELTPAIAAERFLSLMSSEMRGRTTRIAESMRREGDGVTAAANSFYRNLPVEDMVCDVSLLLGESRLAHVYCKTCGLKMAKDVCDEIHSALFESAEEHFQSKYEPHTIVPCMYVDWSLPPPSSLTEGILQGLSGATHEVVAAMADAILHPMIGAYEGGVQGGMLGLVSGVKSLFSRPLVATQVLYDKVKGGVQTTAVGSKVAQKLGRLDTSRQEYRSGPVERVGAITKVPTFSTSGETELSRGSTTGTADSAVAKENAALLGSEEEADDVSEALGARWYGAESLLMMSAAEARADRSLMLPAMHRSHSVDPAQRTGSTAVVDSQLLGPEPSASSFIKANPSNSLIYKNPSSLYNIYDSGAFEPIEEEETDDSESTNDIYRSQMMGSALSSRPTAASGGLPSASQAADVSSSSMLQSRLVIEETLQEVVSEDESESEGYRSEESIVHGGCDIITSSKLSSHSCEKESDEVESSPLDETRRKLLLAFIDMKLLQTVAIEASFDRKVTAGLRAVIQTSGELVGPSVATIEGMFGAHGRSLQPFSLLEKALVRRRRQGLGIVDVALLYCSYSLASASQVPTETGAQSFFDSAPGTEGIQSAFLSRAHVLTPLSGHGEWDLQSGSRGIAERTSSRASDEDGDGPTRATNNYVVVDVEPTFRL